MKAITVIQAIASLQNEAGISNLQGSIQRLYQNSHRVDALASK